MSRNIKETILRNTTFNIGGKVAATLVSLAIVPFIIRTLGAERYGIWIAVFAFLNYFTLLDFGFGAAGVKYTAEYYAKNDVFSIGQTITASILFYSLTLPAFLIPIIFRERIIGFFKISQSMLPEAVFVMTGALLIFAFSLVFGVFTNVLNGLQRMDLTSTCATAQSALDAIGTVIVLKLGFGLKGLIVLNGVLRICFVVIQCMLAFRIVPDIKKGLMSFNKQLFSKFFRYGIKLQVAGIAGLVNSSLDKILIGHFLRIDWVTLYELGSKIAMFIRSVPMLLLPPLVPASSELYSLHDQDRLRTLYRRGSKYISIIAIPVAFFIAAMAPTIMSMWMGSDGFDYSILTIRILAVGYLLNMLPGIATPIVRGTGMLQYEMQTCLFIALANLILSIVLILKLGFVGALFGTSLSMSIGYAWYLIRFNRFIKEPLIDFVKNTFLKPIVGAGIGTIAILAIQYRIIDTILSSESFRGDYFLSLSFQSIVFAGVYVGVLLVSNHIEKTDLVLLRDIAVSLRREK